VPPIQRPIDGPVDLSVIIPTHRRPAKLAACLAALASQTLEADRFEVLVGIDGPDPVTDSAARRAWEGAGGGPGLIVLTCPKAGQAAARNRLLALARGRYLLFLNDDMVPQPGLAAAHLRHQEEQTGRRAPALIVGDAPWKRRHPDRLFDRLLRETSMVFFYDVMRRDPDPQRDWGFRHGWMLNLSIPAAPVREVGGLSIFPATYGYEDDDLAFRLSRRFGMPVLYRPDAEAIHDHAMEPGEYLERERRLGGAARGFAHAAPEAAHAMFGRDLLDPAELDYSREFLAREARAAERLEAAFLGLAAIPAQAIAGPSAAALINLIYQQHLLLKRYHWRRGLLAAAESEQPAAPGLRTGTSG
jgi:GT2 family glycosyltransferase